VNYGRFPRAKAHQPKTGMNGLEKRFSERLELLRLAGKIVKWRYEPFGLRLASKTFYHPDFMVVEPDGYITIYETKGFMQDDANVKIKVAAEEFPEFKFVLVKWNKKDGFFYKTYPPHAEK